MALVHSPKIVTDNLVLCLDAGNTKSYPGTGTAWNDLSGNGNNGTLTNGPTFSSNNGGSIVLDGSNDYVDGTNDSSVNITGDITVEVWFTIESDPNDWVRIFGKGNSTDRTYGLWYKKGSNHFLWQRRSSSGSWSNVSYYPSIILNKWYQMVGTQLGTAKTLYIDGESVGTSTWTGPSASSSENYTIGGATYHAENDGSVSICRLYNRALTAAEVKQNFDAHKGRFGL